VKILYFCADFGLPVGGNKAGALHIRQTLCALVEAGAELLLAAPQIDENFKLPGVTAIPVELDEVDQKALERTISLCSHLEFESRFYKDLRGMIYNSTAEAALKEILRREDPDIVYERYALWHLGCQKAAREAKIPHILEVNAPLCAETDLRRGLHLPDLARAVERHLFTNTDAVICVSHSLRRWLLEECKIGRPVTVLPNAVDPELFHPEISGRPVRQKLGLDDKLVIGFVGSMKRWHGLPELFSALEPLSFRFPEARLLLVGPPNGDTPASSAAGQTIWAGDIPHDQIPEYIAAMDICVLPNSNAYGSPLKLFEYMAMQKPVVAPRVGPVEEILTDGENGRLVSPGSVSELAAVLSELAKNGESRQKLARRAMADILAKHTLRHRANEILQLAQELTDRREPGKTS
jgi:glycosyltransferase involved in cell wall biosynthesis